MVSETSSDLDAAAWPEREDQKWKVLADSAARTLFAANAAAGFHAELPVDDGADVAPVAGHRAWDALLVLADLAPEWARSADLEPALRDLIGALVQPQPISDVLAGCGEELEVSDPLWARVPVGDPAPVIQRRAVPCAVAAVAAARARAVLLAAAGDSPHEVHDDVLPIADVAYQAALVVAVAEESQAPTVHPYVIHVLARAAALCELAASSSGLLNDTVAMLQAAAAADIETMLAQNTLYGPRSVNGVALAFAAATLALPPDADARYVSTALTSCAAAQENGGLWAEGRRLANLYDPDTGAPTVLSSHEVAAAIADALHWRLPADPDAASLGPVTHGLRRAISHAAEAAVILPDRQVEGWAVEATYGRAIVDTDATAAVLRLMVTTRRVAEAETAARSLNEFDLVWDPNRDPGAPYLDWDAYVENNEPDAQNPLLPLLDERFVQPILRHQRQDRRPWSRPRTKSLLLFGPPGTTKTTIVKAMSKGLGWPLVTLSPGTFIRDGLEHVEQRAIRVFRRLERLSGVVVLFDECDELFRSREHTDRADNDQIRSISAFMTASMLPKLQDLRDRERILFVIATNYFDQIDSAVKRIGRIDHIVGVGWPDSAQRRHMIDSELGEYPAFRDLDPAIRDSAANGLATATRYCIRGDVVALASKLGNRAGELNTADDVEPLIRELTEKAPKVSPKDREAFVRDAAASSETHREGRGELVP